uniref:CCHC-type domain-containing protein n=1 Tax=Ananas comosus var. bracteatus TaxID=296719 RepID=A0A6V7QUG4_ANACO
MMLVTVGPTAIGTAAGSSAKGKAVIIGLTGKGKEAARTPAPAKGKEVAGLTENGRPRWRTAATGGLPGLSLDLERRFQELKQLERRCQELRPKLATGVNASTYPSSSRLNERPSSKKVIWADSAGLDLAQVATFCKLDPPRAPIAPVEDTSNPQDQQWTEVRYKRKGKLSYKEALLSSAPPHPLRNRSPHTPPPSHYRSPHSPHSNPPSKLDPLTFKGRCFRCLGRNHRAVACREPIRCARCLKVGHKARACMNRLPMAVYRAMRARPSYLNVYVPMSEDFFARQNRRRNAILVVVVPPANLGHFAQDTIANGLANRFGGFPTDFLVAKYRERDFVVFLPEWVRGDSLIHRQTITLGDIRLRCYAWNPYSGARRSSPPYKVWIRLVSLPYECWSSRTAAALVAGFGRFIRADELTTRMVDLSGYRCLVAVNHLSDIPENLDIAFGDTSMLVLIQLERWPETETTAAATPPTS